MYFEKIHIDKFGGLKNVELCLDNSPNVIYGDNESGKSTYGAFISYIFYGFREKSERTFRIGWGDDSAGGYIILVNTGGKFRISRETFSGGKENLEISEADSGKTLTGIKDPGQFFFGISREVFNNTVFVRQNEGAKVDGNDINGVINNIMFSADERIDTKAAEKKLDALRTELLHKNHKGGRIFELLTQIDELRARISEAEKKDIYRQSRICTLANIKNTLAEKEEKCKELDGIIKKHRNGEYARSYLKVRSYNEKLCAAAAAQSAVKAEYAGATFPDKEYIAELESLLYEKSSLEKEAAELDKSLVLNETALKDAQNGACALPHCRDKASVMVKYKLKSRLSKVFFALDAVFLLLCLVFFISPVFAIIPAVLFAASAICTAVFGITAGRILKSYSASDKRELESVLETLEKSERETASLLEENARIKTLSKRNTEKTADLNVRVGSALEKSGKESLNEALEDAKRALNEYDTAHSDELKYRELMENTVAPIRNISKFDLEQMVVNMPSDEWMESFDSEKSEKDRQFYTMTLEKHREEIHNIEKELASLNASSESCEELYCKLEEAESKLKSCRDKYDAVILASEKLQRASESVRTNIGPQIAEKSGELLSVFSEGRYDEIGMGENGLEYRSDTDGRTYRHSIDYMSAGTADIAYLAVRMALARKICENERIPLIFDESFARLDDSRLRSVLKMICAEHDLQSIIFTSHKRESELFRTLGKFYYKEL